RRTRRTRGRRADRRARRGRRHTGRADPPRSARDRRHRPRPRRLGAAGRDRARPRHRGDRSRSRGEGSTRMSAQAARVRRDGDEATATPANLVTIARLILAVPTLLLVVDQGSSWLTVSLWFVLTTTDGLDGWLARRDGTTRSGAFLDPLADKFLVLGG